MSEDAVAHHHDDQSHYEISLTAGQAFVAFVLLLLSLAASFAFGLMIGKGQADERLVVRKEPSVINEAAAIPAKKDQGKVVEIGVADDDFVDAAADAPPAETSRTSTASEFVEQPPDATPAIIEEASAANATPAAADAPVAEKPVVHAQPAQTAPVKAAAAAPRVPHYAQLLSTGERKTAEALAVKLIESGFTSAYVQPGTTEKGPIYRVRVKFSSEEDARAAEPRLRTFSKDVWITSK